MPSYKEHVLVSIIMVFPFFPEIFYIALAVIGASIIDMDHQVNQKNHYYIGIIRNNLGINTVYITISLSNRSSYSFNGPLIYLSEHRGFMHSIIGIFFITGCVSLFVLGAHTLLLEFT